MRILVADDFDQTRNLLEVLLRQWGHEPVMAVDGQGAWEILDSDDSPRMAILDWTMPPPDGPALCRRLYGQRVEKGRFVYVILLTGKNQITDLVEALAAGAHDFISKPFDAIELRSRIHVGMQIVEYEEILEQKNAEVLRIAGDTESVARDRAEQLVSAGRAASLGAMSTAVLHEIQNPLFAISGNLQSQENALDRFTSIAQSGKYPELLPIERELRDTLGQMRADADRAGKMIQNLGAFARKEAADHPACSANAMVANAVAMCGAVSGGVRIQERLANALPTVPMRTQEIEQVLVNLITNACHALEGRPDAIIFVSTREAGDGIEFAVEDNGPGIPPGAAERIFEAFFTTKAPSVGIGLGLSICSIIAENHGGRITCENRAEGGGAMFTLWIPSGARND